MTRYEQGFMNKCAEYGVMEKQAFTLLELLAALGLAGGVGIGERAAYKHNPKGFRRGAGIGAASGATAGGLMSVKNIGKILSGPGPMKQKALRALAAGAGSAVGGGALGAVLGAPIGSLSSDKS